jgi:HPt (histidine-containing phosphotransfer) domain-containing protein
MTAQAFSDDRDRCLEVGMNDYLSKPIDPEMLIDVIERSIGDSSAESIQRSGKQTKESQIEVFDQNVLTELFGDDEQIIHSIVDGFIEEFPPRLTEMRQSLEQADAQKTNRIAHALKGAAATVGAMQLRDIALEIESAGAEKDLDRCRSLFSKLEASWISLLETLNGDYT